ncbi:hypothetical protein [Spirosoma sp.]|nr:hypothetical protein [Spirosoma sp.]
MIKYNSEKSGDESPAFSFLRQMARPSSFFSIGVVCTDHLDP